MHIFVYHEKVHYGAGQALLQLEKYHKTNNISTTMLYLYNIHNISIFNEYQNPVVICNTIASYPLVEALSKTNVTTYWYIHEWIDDTYNWLRNFNPAIFDSNVKPIFVCNASYENFKKRIPSIKNHTIMYNSISQQVLQEKVYEFKVNRPDNIVIAMIGSVEYRKNQQVFIDNVFSKITQPVTLLLVGRVLKPLYINAQLKSRITVIDHVHNALPYIMSSDIIVCYSSNEVMPMHIIESFYCKKPVISTNVGGISEMIEDGVNGYLITNAPTCIERINELLQKERREQMGEKAYETYCNKFENTFKLLT
jgi:glycosyltransferase involved in cell wall biosynthesis